MTKFLVFNGYGGSNPRGPALASWVNRIGPDVAMISEIGNLVDNLRGVGKVRVGDDRPNDVGMFMKKNMDGITRKQLTRFIARPGSESPMLWRDRHLIRVREGNEVFYALHANAYIQGEEGKWLGHEGAKVWRDALENKIAPMIINDHDKGYHVRLGGDMNFLKSDAAWSPNDFCKRTGLRYRNDRYIWAAWTRSDKFVSAAILGRAPGADAHNAIVVKVEK